jgi:diguanylate cyclase (GGDEF)-like protein/PAS domain S-box-containing protein
VFNPVSFEVKRPVKIQLGEGKRAQGRSKNVRIASENPETIRAFSCRFERFSASVLATFEDLSELAGITIGGSGGLIWMRSEAGGSVAAFTQLLPYTSQLMETLGAQMVRDQNKILTWQDPDANEIDPTDSIHDGIGYCALCQITDAHGEIVGAICGFDTAPRSGQLSARQERGLELLAAEASRAIVEHAAEVESEQDYRCLMELDPHIRWIAGAQGYILELNGRWGKLTGGAREAAMGGGWRSFIHPDDLQGALAGFSAALRQGGPFDLRFRLRTTSGAWCWTRTRAHPRYDALGNLLRWYGTTEDCNAQATVELQARDSGARLDTVFNQAMVGILHRDLNGRVLMANERYCALVGRTARELCGLPMEAFTHPDDCVWNVPLFLEKSVGGEPFQIEKRYVRPDGSVVWCAIHVSFVRDQFGAPQSTITVAQDISAKREAEEALRESKDLLQTVIDSVSDLIFVKDSVGRFVLANRAMREGCHELSEDVPPDFFSSSAYRGYRSVDERVMETGEAVALDEMISFHGQERPFETIKVPWRKGTEIAGIIGVSRDIADRINAQNALRESEAHYRNSVELNPQVPWTATPDGLVEELGPRWADFTGADPADARGHGWSSSVHPDDSKRTIAAWTTALETHRPIDIEYRLRGKGDRYRWVRARGAPSFDTDGGVLRWYGTLEDVDDRRRAEEGLRESEERFRLATQAAGLGIWDYDLAQRRHKWSGAIVEIFGLSEARDPDPLALLAMVHPDDRHRVMELIVIGDAHDTERKLTSAVRIKRENDGSERWVHASSWHIGPPAGEPSRILLTMRDVTEERSADERIRWAARHDALTSLPNRAAFQEALDGAMRQAEDLSTAVGLLLLDVDHLKQTNDCFGHDAGDALLRTLADRLQAVAGGSEVVARLGGDEFAILLRDVHGEAGLLRVVEAISQSLRDPFVYGGRILDCHATIGGSLYPRDGHSGAELLKAADMALYAAKSAGRGGLLLFRPEMRADMQRRSSMISLARTAIDNERVTPFYQPQVELCSGRLVGFEALLRWHHPGTGIHLPGDISAAFDNLDLAVALSDRMFGLAIADMRRWLDEGIEFGTIAVNASAAEFRHDDLAERVLDRLARAGVPATRLEVEVTEMVFLGSGADYVDRALKVLSGAGVRIALDDFGTGYASLSHLKQYPVDIIKIDRGFVSELGRGADDAAIVDAVINLGSSLGMEIIAEGIETQAQADYLIKRGCGFGQGHLFGRATDALSIPDLVARWRQKMPT